MITIFIFYTIIILKTTQLIMLLYSIYSNQIFYNYYIQRSMISQIQLKNIDLYQLKRSEVLIVYPSILGLSDSVIYTYTKDATFLRPKQERNILYFFQGLNTNPQNLSIFLMQQSSHFIRLHPSLKEKITKGIFNVFDIYNKWDCVIQINIPGNLKIYKIVSNKKQIVSSEEIDLMYVSSVIRTFYQKNMCWGKYYQLFKDEKDILSQFNNFLKIFFRIAIKHQIFISQDFEANAQIKGSHSLTLLFRFVKQKRICSSCLNLLKKQMQNNIQLKKSPKFNIFLAELYSQEGKFSKSIQCTIFLANQYSNDPYVLFYKAKYLYSLLMIQQALNILNLIVQYNQFQIWCLLAKIHIQNKNFTDSLICLNNAAKLSKYKASKQSQHFWKVFQQIGKIKSVSVNDPILHHIKLNLRSESPLSIPVKFVEQKYIPLMEHPSWKLNYKQKQVYKALQNIFYKMQLKKFQELLQQTFQEQAKQVNQVSLKKGLTDSMFIDIQHENAGKIDEQNQISAINVKKKFLISTSNLQDQLPHFLKQQQSNCDANAIQHQNRNLSIIPQIQSVIENSNYQQKLKIQNFKKRKHRSLHKREMNQQMFKILKSLFSDGQFQRAIYQSNYPKILPVFNKLRNSSVQNNYYFTQMFKIFVQTGNFNSIVVLVAQYLDFVQSKGMKKMRKLPYWVENWIFHIIDQKGLLFLNNTLTKLNYIDEAVIDSIQNAKKWKLRGVSY